jgi:hypothetical protein
MKLSKYRAGDGRFCGRGDLWIFTKRSDGGIGTAPIRRIRTQNGCFHAPAVITSSGGIVVRLPTNERLVPNDKAGKQRFPASILITLSILCLRTLSCIELTQLSDICEAGIIQFFE